MAVAANHRLAGQSVAQVRANDVDDALIGAEPVVKSDAVFLDVFLQRVQLLLGNLVGYGQG